MNMDDEASNLSTFDIYSDLLLEQQTQGVHVSVDQLEKTNAENEAKLKELNEQLQNVQLQCTTLVEENAILKRNISELFKTAQAELKRKDRQLEQLSLRKPRNRREDNYKSSVNDRLRNLRHNPRGCYPQRTNGADLKKLGGDQETEEERGMNDAGKPGVSGREKTESYSPRQCGRPDRTNTDMSPTESKLHKNQEKISDNIDDQSEEQLTVETNRLNVNTAGYYSRDSECHKRGRQQNKPGKPPQRESGYSSRIPNGLSSRDHRDKTEHEHPTKTERLDGTGYSSSRHTRDSTKNDRKPSRSCSPHRGRSSERSKLRGRSRGSDRSSKRSNSSDRNPDSVKSGSSKLRENIQIRKHRTDSATVKKSAEPLSGRKRKHSSSRKDYAIHRDEQSRHRSSYIAPHKKQKAHDGKGDYPKRPSDRRTSSELAFQSSLPEGYSATQTDVSRTILHKKRHSSKKSSHSITKRMEEDLACNEEHSRKRHESDRKNKSLKRARDTLHRMHSTPKNPKHKRETSHRRNHRHSSKTYQSNDEIKDVSFNGNEDFRGNDLEVESNEEWIRKERLQNVESKQDSTACEILTSAGPLENNDFEMKDEEPLADFLYGHKEMESTVHKHEEPICSHDSEEYGSRVKESTPSQSGTDQEIADGNFKTVINNDVNNLPTSGNSSGNPSHVRQMIDSINQEKHILKDLKESKTENQNCDAETKELQSSRKPHITSTNHSSSEVMLSASGNQVSYEGSNSKSCSFTSSPSKAKCHQITLKSLSNHSQITCQDPVQDKLMNDEHDVQSDCNKDLECVGANAAELADVTPQEHLDESEADCKAKEWQKATSRDSCSKSVGSTKEKASDSFSEKILDVFGSNSFLWSDDLDGSIDVHLPPNSDTSLQGNSASRDHLALNSPKKVKSFSETMLNPFGSNSFLEIDDLESIKEVPLNTDAESPCKPATKNRQRENSTSLCGSTEKDCFVVKENDTSVNILETILETYDTSSFTNVGVDSKGFTSPMSVLVTNEPMILSEDAMFENLQSTSAANSDSKVRNEQTGPANHSFGDFGSTLNEHGQEKLHNAILFQSDEYNTDVEATEDKSQKVTLHDATNELYTKDEACMSQLSGTKQKKSFHNTDETYSGGVTDDNSDKITSPGKLYKTDLDKRVKATNENEDLKNPRFDTEAINQQSISGEESVSSSFNQDEDETPCNYEQPDIDVGISFPEVTTKSPIRNVADKIIPHSNGEDDIIDSVNHGCLVEDGDAADISIDPCGYDTLSCSASPVNRSLLGDSDNSCHSNQDYHINQAFCNQVSDHHMDGKPPQNCDLSEGEIASSDSETATDVTDKKEKAGRTANKKTNQTRSKPSPKWSRKDDKRSSGRNARGYSPSRSRDRHSKLHDREKFFEMKMKILEERQHALGPSVKRHSDSKYGAKSTNERGPRAHSSNRNQLASRERLSPEKRRATCKKTAVDPWSRRDDPKVSRSTCRVVDDVTRSHGSHSSSQQSTRRNDRVQSHDRQGKNQDRRLQSTEEKTRNKSSRTYRR